MIIIHVQINIRQEVFFRMLQDYSSQGRATNYKWFCTPRYWEDAILWIESIDEQTP